MNEDIQTTYLLIRGFEYEGSGVLSLHRELHGARVAAEEFMKNSDCYSDDGWQEGELHPTQVDIGYVAEWYCGDQYLRIHRRLIQE